MDWVYYDVCTVDTAQDWTNTTGKVCVHVNPTVRTNVTVQTWNTYLSADIPWSKVSHTHAQASADKYEEITLTDKYPGAQFRVESMIYLSQTSRTLSSVPQTHLWERPCCSSLHIHKKKNKKNKHNVEQRGSTSNRLLFFLTARASQGSHLAC